MDWNIKIRIAGIRWREQEKKRRDRRGQRGAQYGIPRWAQVSFSIPSRRAAYDKQRSSKHPNATTIGRPKNFHFCVFLLFLFSFFFFKTEKEKFSRGRANPSQRMETKARFTACNLRFYACTYLFLVMTFRLSLKYLLRARIRIAFSAPTNSSCTLSLNHLWQPDGPNFLFVPIASNFFRLFLAY